jgi:hypothetical protein
MRLQLIVGALCALALTARAGVAAADDVNPLVANASLQTTTYVDSDHVTVTTPVAAGEVADRSGTWNVRGQYLVDIISAASVDIVSTASQRWSEVRHAAALQGGYKPGDIGVQASAAFSSEPDYLSFAGGGKLLWDFADKNYTAILGYAFDHDTIGRAGTPFSVFSHSLAQHTIDGGITLTLNRSAALSLIGDVILERGDQSKPYRYIPMFSSSVAPTIHKGESIDTVNAERLPERPLERLPDSRERYALTARFAYRFARSTLRADERVYTDSWSLHASTTDLRYYLNVSPRFTLWPRLRGHVQNGVSFWERAYVSTFGPSGWEIPAYRAGDRELGPLFTLTAGLGASYALGSEIAPSAWSVELQADFMDTQFLDDVYVKSRTAGLGTVGVRGVFE